jgi:hypothetical protein
MRTIIPVSALLMLLSVGGCTSTDVVNTAQIYDPVDAVQPYAQRADKIRLSAGDAQAVNTRIHEVDPWPRNVGDKRIYSNGQKMADAVWRYRCGKEPQRPLQGEETSQLFGGGAGGAGGGGGGSAVNRPGSDCGGAQVQTPARAE